MAETIIDAGLALKEVISYFYLLSCSENDVKVLKHLMPNLEMMLVFNFGLPVPYSFDNSPLNKRQINRIAVLGPLKKRLNYELQPGCNLIVVNFTLNGFYRFFGVSMAKVKQDELYDPDKLNNGNYYSLMWERLAQIENTDGRINGLRIGLLNILNSSEPASEALLNGRSYFNDPAKQPVKAIASDHGLAQRTVQLRFQKYLGYSTKELIRFKRFKLVVSYLSQMEPAKINWVDVAVSYGYYDQSHLIKDFNYFLATTPEYFIHNINKFCIIQDSYQ